MRLYKACALLGTLIILLDIGVSWSRINAFESSVSNVFESIITTQMLVEGLQQELQHIDTALAQYAANEQSVSADGIEYNAQQLQRLRNERADIKLYMREKQRDISLLNKQKKFIMDEVRVLFLLSLLFLILGTLLSAFGYLAWYFKVELFADRRKTARD
jgi:ABC-type multidrug transport system fused ATPase/permease subunit